MVKHVLCWKLKEHADGRSRSQNAKLMAEKLMSLKEKIKEVKKIEVGINDLRSKEENFDLIMISEFDSFEDLRLYIEHPEHVKIAKFIKNIREIRAAVDYEVKD
jgi:hypothetical protein